MAEQEYTPTEVDAATWYATGRSRADVKPARELEAELLRTFERVRADERAKRLDAEALERAILAGFGAAARAALAGELPRVTPMEGIRDAVLALEPAARLTQAMIEAGARELDECAADAPQDYPLSWEAALSQSQSVLEAALGVEPEAREEPEEDERDPSLDDCPACDTVLSDCAPDAACCEDCSHVHNWPAPEVREVPDAEVRAAARVFCPGVDWREPSVIHAEMMKLHMSNYHAGEERAKVFADHEVARCADQVQLALSLTRPALEAAREVSRG